MSRDLDRAIVLAVQAHSGQLDKGGHPYILHCLRVMLAVDTETERIAAVLHDVVEDAGVRIMDLYHAGFADEVVEAVASITRRKGAGENYADYIERVALNPVARRVKIADLRDNMNPDRAGSVLGANPALAKRYRRAYHRLTALGAV